jgi:hypothetical protein
VLYTRLRRQPSSYLRGARVHTLDIRFSQYGRT